jgi:regulator of sigma E protease
MDLSAMVGAFGGIAWATVFFVLALLIIVAVHEYGHYIVGRLCGIHAEVFSLGFGPKLYSRVDSRGTRWQIALLPFGGFVKFLGDADASSRPDEAGMIGLTAEERRHTMHGAPLWARSATVVAGPAFNIVLTLLLFFGMILYTGVALDQPVVGKLRPVPYVQDALQVGDRITALNDTPTPDLTTFFQVADKLGPLSDVAYAVERDGAALTVQGPHPLPPLAAAVYPESAALDAGLQPGDFIVRAAGQPIATFAQLPDLIEATGGQPITLTVWRAGETFDLTLSPRRRDLPTSDGGFETRWMIGLSGGVLFDPASRTPGIVEAAQLSWSQTWYMAKTTFSGLAHIVSGAISTCNISGPIGMAKVVGAAAQTGWQTFIQTLALLSLSIGILNLFPIPVLDGGHLVFHVWEATTGRAPTDRALQVLMSVGLAMLISLMVFAVSNDLFLCS